jgi:hypothetical protein
MIQGQDKTRQGKAERRQAPLGQSKTKTGLLYSGLEEVWKGGLEEADLRSGIHLHFWAPGVSTGADIYASATLTKIAEKIDVQIRL